MPEARVSTTLEIKTNARQVGDLDRQLKQTFSPGKARELQGAIGQVNRAVVELIRNVEGLNRLMQAVERGVASYDRLAASLRSARQEAAGLESALERVGSAGARGGRAMGGPGAAGGGGAGDIRNWGFGGGPQLPMPGMGAMATAAMAVPVMGMIAAGSMLAAAGTYSSMLRYQQATAASAAFLGSSTAAMGLPGRAAVIGAGQETAARALLGGRESALTGAIESAQRPGGLLAEASWAVLRERAAGGDVAAMMATGTAAGPGGARGAILGASRWLQGRPGTPGGGETASERYQVLAESIVEARDERDEIRKSISTARLTGPGAAARDWLAVRAGLVSAGARFGVMPADALQQAAGVGRAAGRPVTAEQYQFGLAAQMGFGVSLEQTGGLMRGLRRAGVENQPEEIARMIGAAVARGLEGSEIGEDLGQTAQLLDQMAATGQTVNTGALLGVTQRLAATPGMPGYLAGAVARQFGAAGAEVGFRGPQNAAELLLMRAVGWTGQGGPEEYAAARLAMQDPGRMAEALPRFLELGGAGRAGGPAMRTLMTQRMMAAAGVRVGVGPAAGLAGGIAAAGETPETTMQTILAVGDVARTLVGALSEEAAIEGERIQIGGRMAETMQALERSTNNMASAFTNSLGPAIEGAAKRLDEFSGILDDLFIGLGARESKRP